MKTVGTGGNCDRENSRTLSTNTMFMCVGADYIVFLVILITQFTVVMNAIKIRNANCIHHRHCCLHEFRLMYANEHHHDTIFRLSFNVFKRELIALTSVSLRFRLFENFNPEQ